MKLIIIEGPDNCGKNTLIQNIVDNNDIIEVIHCHKPVNPDRDPFEEMTDTYYQHYNNIVNEYKNNYIDVIVFNRFYQSEYVYGPLYRNGDPDKIKELINDIEIKLIYNIGWENIYYVQLLSDSPDVLINNEDGQSLSTGQYDMINEELKRFKDVYDMSILNKRIIYVNINNEFRKKEYILNDFNNFIN